MTASPTPPGGMHGDASLFRTLIATAVDGIMVIDEQGFVQVYNDACMRLFQYRPEEVIGRNVNMLMPSPYREGHDDYIKHYRETGEARIIGIGREVHGQRKDGSVFPMYLSVGEGSLDDKRIFVGIIHDLTLLKREQAAREEQKGYLAAIVESANDAILSKTLDGTITSWNKSAELIFGYKAEEIIGKPITLLFPPDRLSEEEIIMSKIREGVAAEHFETVRARKDGTTVDVSVTVSPMRDADGTIIGASKTVRDITERKSAEARMQTLRSELSHVARVTEMSQFSAAIAHELNQPLTAILNYTNVAKRLIASPEEPATAKAYEAVSKAGEQAVRAGQIIRRLRDFVEKRETNRTLEDIHAIAEDAIALGLIGTKAANIKTRTEFAPHLPLILVDKVQIQQVIVNLLRNAAEAMADSPRRELTISISDLDNEGVEVAVADTGSGIPQELADRLFKPFVTTKAGGMGIGLAISQSIVEAHGGRIKMMPNADGGTVFQFTLPAAPTTE
jgi:two-component system, LuxR family, sensor kinase FixL